MTEENLLILASASPRRFDLMTAAGLSFAVVPAEVEEFHDPAVPLAALTRQNAALKAEWVADRHRHSWVIGADTLVSIGGHALGKPADFTEASQMLAKLAGRTHVVATAVCLVHGHTGRKHEFIEETHVTFKPLTGPEIEHYLTLINPLDKAGSYAAQEHGEFIIEDVTGDYTNVVGLPMARLLAELRSLGAA